MDGKQLRNCILQWAIEGRLVPQCSTDEPAAALLRRIHDEKRRLVAAGQLKKSSLTDSHIYRDDNGAWQERVGKQVNCIDDEIPFDVPEGWEWCRLEKLAQLIIGKTPARGDTIFWEEELFPWVSISDMRDGQVLYKTKEKISQIAAQNIFHNGISKSGSLIMSFKLTVGRTSILGVDAFHNEAIITILPYVDVDYEMRDFLLHILPLITKGGDTKEAIKGTTLNKKSLNNLLVPLPPLSEQRRIVSRLEELLPLVEAYGKGQAALDALNAGLGSSLRRSLLQEAIRGRLVEQRAEEGTAAQLLVDIRREKQRLAKEGRIKKSAINDSHIYRDDNGAWQEKVGKQINCIDDEIPFDLPEGWEWCRLNDVCVLYDGDKREGTQVCLDAKFLRGKSEGTVLAKGRYVCKGDYIILVDGENSGEVFVVPQDGYMGSTFKQLCIASVIYEPYMLMLLSVYKEKLRNEKKGAAIPHLNKTLFYGLLVPLPPLSEQRRIVSRLEELLSLLP